MRQLGLALWGRVRRPLAVALGVALLGVVVIYGWDRYFGDAILYFGNRIIYDILGWRPTALIFSFTIAGALIGVFVHWIWPLGVDSWKRFTRWLWNTRADDRIADENRNEGRRNEERRGIVEVVGVIYAVVVAFVVVTAWQQFDHTEEVGLQERHDVAALYHVIGTFAVVPSRREAQNGTLADGRHTNTGDVIQALLTEYAHNMSSEWKEMGRGVPLCVNNNLMAAACELHDGTYSASVHNNRLVECLIARVTSLVPGGNSRDEVMYQESLQLLGQFIEDRNHRRHHYEEQPLQAILWWSFWIGAAILIVATYLNPSEDSNVQLARTSILCGMIGLMFALGLVFDYPFTGSTGIEDEWPTIVAQFDNEARIRGGTYVNPRDSCPGGSINEPL